jgi:hypothetical protein
MGYVAIYLFEIAKPGGIMNTGEMSPTSLPTFTGSAEEVRNQLEHVKDGQVVAVVFEESNLREAEVIPASSPPDN